MYWVTKVWPNNLCLKVVQVRVGQYIGNDFIELFPSKKDYIFQNSLIS